MSKITENKDELLRERKIQRVTLACSLGNLVLLLFKFFAGIFGNSAAMIADAVHSLSDFATDIVVILFVRLAGKPQDADHNFGHGKYETLATAVIGLVLLINHTKIGMAMRAVSVDFETAQLMGIKINNVISATFIIGTFLAAIGSILFFTNFPGVVPTAGAMPGLKAFVAAVFGGIGSVPGAVVGAFIIGICESVIKGLDTILMANGAITEQVGFATFSDAFTFVLLIVILVFKPTGLFGEKTTDKV